MLIEQTIQNRINRKSDQPRLEGHPLITLSPPLRDLFGSDRYYLVEMSPEREAWEEQKPISDPRGMKAFLELPVATFDQVHEQETIIRTKYLRTLLEHGGVILLQRALDLLHSHKTQNKVSLNRAVITELIDRHLLPAERFYRIFKEMHSDAMAEYLAKQQDRLKNAGIVLSVLSPNGLIKGILQLIDLQTTQNMPSAGVAKLAFELAAHGILVGHNFKNASKIIHHAQACPFLRDIVYRPDLNACNVFDCNHGFEAVERVFGQANLLMESGTPVSLCYLNSPKFGGKAMALFAHDIFAGQKDNLVDRIGDASVVETTAFEIASCVGVAALETPANLAVVKQPRLKKLLAGWFAEFDSHYQGRLKLYHRLTVLVELFSLESLPVRPKLRFPEKTWFMHSSADQLRNYLQSLLNYLKHRPYLFTLYSRKTTRPVGASDPLLHGMIQRDNGSLYERQPSEFNSSAHS